MTTFYKNFIRLCQDKGIKPGPACDGIGLGRAAASKWARGVVPKELTMLKIADFFGVAPEWLTEEHCNPQEFYPTAEEKDLIIRFRKLPQREREIIRYILGVTK